jgi:hypothetical protein
MNTRNVYWKTPVLTDTSLGNLIIKTQLINVFYMFLCIFPLTMKSSKPVCVTVLCNHFKFSFGNCEMVKTCWKNKVNIITMIMMLNK